jgi:L-iditol 2-dehydrogenase
MSYPERMIAARLHGPSDLQIDVVPHPGPPGPDRVLLRVAVTALCGSDLHSFADARIGDTGIRGPLALGHEFAGVVEECGPNAHDGFSRPIKPGTRVAVDPAQPCGQCELCQEGHPNLCLRLRFCGNYPDDGSLREWMHMPARCCFPVPESIDNDSAALLEPLGVALHAIDLAHIRAATSVAILGAGPVGLLILQVAKLVGADPVFISDRFPWRLALAQKYGGIPLHCETEDVCGKILGQTGGLGAHVVIEAAWGGDSVAEAAEVARPGARVVLVGIPSDDRFAMKHTTARRKGLTIAMSRRMKHTYPRAIRLVERGLVDVLGLISHRFSLRRAAEAFQLNTGYRDSVIKVIINHEP